MRARQLNARKLTFASRTWTLQVSSDPPNGNWDVWEGYSVRRHSAKATTSCVHRSRKRSKKYWQQQWKQQQRQKRWEPRNPSCSESRSRDPQVLEECGYGGTLFLVALARPTAQPLPQTVHGSGHALRRAVRRLVTSGSTSCQRLTLISIAQAKILLAIQKHAKETKLPSLCVTLSEYFKHEGHMQVLLMSPC